MSAALAHPRSRGENRSMSASAFAAAGSSPLTRGKPVLDARFGGELGLIPAHAGKTPVVGVDVVSTWAHPRSRGENAARAGGARPPVGSSPLTRGKPRGIVKGFHDRGLIPAHAGKTHLGVAPGGFFGAHPRSRGENVRENRGPTGGLGSSPLTRGKPTCTMHCAQCIGLIPAHAGKTDCDVMMWAMVGAHPRSRGENPFVELCGSLSWGSSPLTRGKPFLTCAFIEQIGQILESLELCASSESYSSPDAYATDALQGRVRSIGLAPRSSRGAS